MYIDSNRAVADDLIRVKYSKSETVESIDEIQHDIAREILRQTGVEKISRSAPLPTFRLVLGWVRPVAMV